MLLNYKIIFYNPHYNFEVFVQYIGPSTHVICLSTMSGQKIQKIGKAPLHISRCKEYMKKYIGNTRNVNILMRVYVTIDSLG